MSDATMVASSSRSVLPGPIRLTLGRLDRRLRAASCSRGLGMTALLIASGAVLGMAIDFAWVVPQGLRWAMWAAWLTLGTIVFVATVCRPLVRRIAALDLAAVAEQAHPELGERLTGTVALHGGATPVHGSPELIAALAAQAAAQAHAIDPVRAVSWRRARGGSQPDRLRSDCSRYSSRPGPNRCARSAAGFSCPGPTSTALAALRSL